MPQQVAIVGAGLAGLSCAITLVDAGVDVTVATSVPCQVVANGDATIVRLFGSYFADALAVFADGATMQLAAGGERDPVYCFDATRVVCTMPTRW